MFNVTRFIILIQVLILEINIYINYVCMNLTLREEYIIIYCYRLYLYLLHKRIVNISYIYKVIVYVLRNPIKVSTLLISLPLSLSF